MSDMQIEIADGATPRLDAIAAQLRHPRALMAALGKELEVCLRAHFRTRENAKDSKRARKGWPSKHFWSGVRSATALTEVTANSATVTIASPAFVHKVRGGTINAPPGKALAIPLTAAAYAADRARLFPRPLTMVVRPGRPPLLVETGTIGKSKKWTLHYVLLKSVTHEPDPKALPDEANVERQILARGEKVFRDELARLNA